MSRLIGRNRLTRALFFGALDLVWIGLAIYIAFLLRFDGRISPNYAARLWIYWGIALALKLPIFALQGLYRMSWAYVSLEDLLAVLRAATLSSLLLGMVLFFLGRESSLFSDFPRSVLIIDYLLTISFIGGFRLWKRIYLRLRSRGVRPGRPALIVGAGDAGEQLARNMLSERASGWSPIGFVDDDPAKRGLSLHGLPVLGTRADLPQIIKAYNIELVLVALPAVRGRVIRQIVTLAREAGVPKIEILPGIHELLSGQVSLSQVREVQPEDLLGRDPVQIDSREISCYLKGKRVLVTGAAGSIGRELSRQVLKFAPARLALLDQDETALFLLGNELSRVFPSDQTAIMPVLADVRDAAKISQVFSAERPEIIFHAAAYKHVPVMEAQPEEAIKTNVRGTRLLAQAALESGAEKFLLISTDKAVRPSSVMGASKRVAELIMQALATQRATSFFAVRFGNVLGSRGSVIPILQEQIKRRGPVTITHPGMKRYMMAISEAVALVLQAGALGQGGEVFVLDMGRPVKILDLARELIRFSGYEPEVDIPIVFSGARPGEKLFEDLLSAEEGTEATRHEKIYVTRLSTSWEPRALFEASGQLEQAAERGDREAVLAGLRELVPTYRPQVIDAPVSVGAPLVGAQDAGAPDRAGTRPAPTSSGEIHPKNGGGR
ncbi:MAG TPA: polysaccharide biosynthesis protein [Candidatus Fraserbacteria bacterium]|mgnify:CR=1 FL=1|nr:polysaccharide biosynthesis protein [Candidatus Fraserbacteria bacterium]